MQNFRSIKELARAKYVSGFTTASLAYLLGNETYSEQSPKIVIFSDSSTAARVHREFKFFQKFQKQKLGDVNSFFYPGWTASPYMEFQPTHSNTMQRLNVISQILNHRRPTVVFTDIVSSLQRSVEAEEFRKNVIHLKKGQNIELEHVCRSLLQIGYEVSDPVENKGYFINRGSIIDIFPPDFKSPIRIDFFDDQIESIKEFSALDQRSYAGHENLEEVVLIPASEIAYTPDGIARGKSNIKNYCDGNLIPKDRRDKIFHRIEDFNFYGQLEYLIPFFNENAESLCFQNKNSEIIFVDFFEIKSKYNDYCTQLKNEHDLSIEEKKVSAPTDMLFDSIESLQEDRYLGRLRFFNTLQIGEGEKDSIHIKTSEIKGLDHARIATTKNYPDKHIKEFKNLFLRYLENSYLVIFIASTQAQLDRVSFLLKKESIAVAFIDNANDLKNGAVNLVNGSLESSFEIADDKVVFISENQVFGKLAQRKGNKTSNFQDKSLAKARLDDLNNGDFIVHKDHGVGIYQGLKRLKVSGTTNDFFLIEYENADKLYLPIYRLEVIQKYIGSGTKPSLDKLGSDKFEKAKEKARKEIKEIAYKLLNLYAKRASSEGNQYEVDSDELTRFEANFPYDETPDQLKAIESIYNDMHSSRPMDRLICGDVGYGKTEIAMRAAFVAAQNSRQVAVLVPTTILAEQHGTSFTQRFKGTAVKIASLSRFKTKHEQKEIVKLIAGGQVDIVIGTHRLLSKDVTFKRLGLIIVDEEQRFGVEHKEKLKALKVNSDVLTLTATPIPRTLQLSMVGLRDISIINTPPVDRQAIQTFLCKFDKKILRKAILQELKRGGQVFFIHNRVHSIESVYRIIEEEVPEAKIGVAHGQMKERNLEEVMFQFYRGELNVLLCTTIIENGLDVPNANTIIVNQADHFGLSQLYQIRGRVGRSQRRAYAYLFIPDEKPITDLAKERLQTLQRFTDLGSGFNIASHDLEMRGGGEIVGDAQSGHISLIGYDMYLELLSEEINRLKGTQEERPNDIEISSSFAAYLPESYIKDPKMRLNFYRRLSSLVSEEEVRDAESELKERYGEIPKETAELLNVLHIKALLRRLGFSSATLSKDSMRLTSGENVLVEPEKLLGLIQKDPKKFQITPDSKLCIRKHFPNAKDALEELRTFMSDISEL